MHTEPESLPSRAWLMVGLLWFVAALNYLDRLILITMRASITEAIPMSDAQFGLLTTAFLVSYALLSPLGGFVADRLNRSHTIIFSLFAWSAATWLTAHATSFGELLCYRALMGVSEACYFPAAAALLMDYHRHSTRSLANGIHLSGVMVGTGLGGLGGWIAEHHHWSFVFELFGVAGMLYSLALLLLLRDLAVGGAAGSGHRAGFEGASTDQPGRVAAGAATDGRDRQGADAPERRVRLGEAFVSLFSRRAFVLALVLWGLLGLASWALVGWVPTYLSERFHLSQSRAGLIALGYIYSASLVGMVLSGAWGDRWSKVHPRGRIRVGIVGVLLAVPAILLVANASVLGLLLAGLLLYGFARPFPDANMVPILCEVVDRRYLATGVGILNTFGTLVGGASIYAGGVLRDAHVDISVVFNVGAAGFLLCAFLLWRLRPAVSLPS
jgi:MFS family permease